VAAIHPKAVLDEDGNPVAVQLTLAEYKAPVKHREDHRDLQLLKKAVKRGGTFTSLQEVGKRLGFEK
jgi:hypothetical protein